MPLALSEIATRLAALRFNIMTNGCPGVPQAIVEHYIAARERELAIDLSALKYPGQVTSPRGVSPSGFPSSGDVTFYCDVNFEVLSAMNPHFVDCVIVVGGGLGSLLECISAVMNDLPIICFGSFGGAAELIPPLFHQHQSGHLKLVLHECRSIQELSQSLHSVASGFLAKERTTNLSKLIEHTQSAPDDGPLVRIRVAEGLAHVEYAVESDTLRIDNPRLLDDPSAFERGGRVGAIVKSRLSVAARRYEYGQVHVSVRPHHVRDLWGPSIDSFVLAEAAARSEAQHMPAQSALDVGCGSGILALWLKSTGLANSVLGMDRQSISIKCAIENASQNGLDCTFVEIDFRHFQADQTFDLILCNPPYVSFGEDSDELALISDLLTRFSQFLSEHGRCYFVLSSAALHRRVPPHSPKQP